jgi:hypothetical protein
MDKHFTASSPASGLVFPQGCFTRRLRPRRDDPWSELRLAASDLGAPRIELMLVLTQGFDDVTAAALYEEVDFLWATGYRCHFSRVPDSRQLQLKAHMFIRAGVASDAEFVEDIPTVADADELAAWLRLSVAVCRKVLVACASAH